MANLFARLLSRVFPKKVSEEFELGVVRPQALGYRLRPAIEIDGQRRPTPPPNLKGRFTADGLTYMLDPKSRETRQRICDRLKVKPSVAEVVFSGEADEDQLKLFLDASGPEVSVSPEADSLIKRPDAPLEVTVDFEPSDGSTKVELKLGARSFDLPETSVGALLEADGRWFRLTQGHRALLEHIRNTAPERVESGRYRVAPGMTPQLMPLMRGRPEVEMTKRAAEVRVSKEPAKAEVELEEDVDESLIVRPTLRPAGSEHGFNANEVEALPGGWMRRAAEFFPRPNESDPVFEAISRLPGQAKVPRAGVPEFLLGPPAGPRRDIARRWRGESLKVDERPPQTRVDVDLEPDGRLSRTPTIETAEGTTLVRPGEPAPPERWARLGRTFFRNPTAEQVRDARAEGGSLTSTDEIADFLIRREESQGAKKKFRLGEAAKRIRIDASPATRVVTNVDLDTEPEKLRLRIGYEGNAARIPHESLRDMPSGSRYYREGDRFQRVDRATFKEIEEELRDLGGEESDGGYSFPAYLFDELINRFSRLGLIEQGALFSKWLERLLDFTKIEPVSLPQTLRPEWLPRQEGDRPGGIRPYQQKGYDWLCFLKKYGFGGVLADEMGLGKTVQVLMALARYKEDNGRWCSLIVTQKSAMSHWEQDSRRFFDGLVSRRWVSFERSVAAQKPETVETKFDFVLVNYERVRSDIEFLKKIRFRFVILDEAQKTKNPASINHRTIAQLRAESKIAVTATPVETRLRDLWSLFHIMMPGKLGTESEFVRRYEPRQDLEDLTRRVRPFMLVRKKSMPEIAVQLPGKSYRDRECEMEDGQRELYDSIRHRERQHVVDVVKTRPSGDAHIFSVLQKLLQVCLHPVLVRSAGPRGADLSGKAKATMELLEELLRDPGNKVLVFSRFLGALDLLKEWSTPILEEVDAESFVFSGATAMDERDRMIKVFNEKGSRERVMFVSLMAGGAGINLQGANHVIHFDRWWNPAIEWQAEDRAYRLNSEKPVTVHRIVTRDSIEERVAAVIEDGKSLVRDTMDPQAAVEKLITREELLRIFGVQDQ